MVCGDPATVVDDPFTFCDRCEAGLIASLSDSVSPNTEFAAGSASPLPPREPAAINSQLDASVDLPGLDRSAIGTGSRSTPGEKDCACFPDRRNATALRIDATSEIHPAS